VRQEYFEELYRREAEPWSYSTRAAESLRHDIIAAIASAPGRRCERALDVGCSIGQLTGRLAGTAPCICGIDISPTAVRMARARCGGLTGSTFAFAAASAALPPFRARSFDLLLLCDGLQSWRLAPEEQAATLEALHDVARPGALVILTDHLKVRDFDPFIERVRHSPLEVERVSYLHDRLWYTLERALRPIRHRTAVQRLLASKRVGRALMAAGRLAGRRGAKHLLIVARRQAE
jgi:SAM-dependent methyltransferase